MRNNQDKGRRDQTGRGVTNPVARPPDYTAEQRETVRQGLRILAKIIARAQLRRQAGRSSAAAPARRLRASTVSEQFPEMAAPTDVCLLR